MSDPGGGVAAQVGELIDLFARRLERLDVETSRALLAAGEVALAIDDLAFELGKRAPLQRTALARLAELGALAGASADAVTSLRAQAERRSVLGLGEQTYATPAGQVTCRELSVDGVAVTELAMFPSDDPEAQLAELDDLAGLVPGRREGRVVIGRCTACGDPDCGETCCRIEIDGDVVWWRDVGGPVEAQHEPLEQLGPFSFERAAYLAVLAELRAGVPGTRYRPPPGSD